MHVIIYSVEHTCTLILSNTSRPGFFHACRTASLIAPWNCTGLCDLWNAWMDFIPLGLECHRMMGIFSTWKCVTLRSGAFDAPFAWLEASVPRKSTEGQGNALKLIIISLAKSWPNNRSRKCNGFQLSAADMPVIYPEVNINSFWPQQLCLYKQDGLGSDQRPF